MVREVENPTAPAARASCDDRGHGPQVLLRGVLVGRPSLAHHVEPYGPVRDLGGDIDRVASLVEQVEVLAEGLPSSPGHAHAEGRTGDVLDSLHQVDQRVVVSRPDGGEADTAVPHHECRHPIGG